MSEGHVSAYKAAKSRNKYEKKKHVSAYKAEKTNRNGFAGGIGYIAGRAGTDFLRVGEGVWDAAMVPLDLMTGQFEKAGSRFMNSPVDDLRERLDRQYNPGKGMQVVGDITGGIGQSVGYGLISSIPYAGTPMMFSSIVEQGISSAAKQTGEVGWNEIAYGATTGALEGFLEMKLGSGVRGLKSLGSSILKKSGKEVVESAAKAGGKSLLKTVALDTAKGAAGEFAEEAISEAVDPLLLRLYNIDENAQFSWENVLYAGVVGGISGGIMSAGPSAINYKSAVSTGRAIQQNGLAGDMLTRAKTTLTVLDASVTEAESRIKGKPVGEETESREAKRGRLAENRRAKQLSKETRELADKLRKNIAAYESMMADPSRASSDVAAAVLGEMRGNLFLVGFAYEADVIEQVLMGASAEQKQSFVNEINAMLEKQGQKHDYTVADFENNVDDIRRGLAGRLMMDELQGNTAEDGAGATQTAKEAATDPWEGMADNEDMSGYKATGEAEKALLWAAVNENVPRGSVQAMLDEYRKGTDMTPEEFAEAWSDGVHLIGRFDLTVKEDEDTAFNRLPKEAREAARRIGRETAERENAQREAKAKEKKKPAEQAGKKGKVVRGEGLNIQKLSDEQYAAYKAAEVMAKRLGTDIVIENSIEDTAGRATYGYYDRKTNTIHININALRDGKHVALYTLGHEVTHYIKEWSPAKFKVLSDFVMERMSGDAKDLIDAKFNLLRGMEEYKDYTVAELNELAAEEVVADGMELILTDGKVLEELAREDKTLWEKIRDWVMEIIGQIRRSFESLSGASKTAKVLAETMETFDEIERLFTEGVREAGERAKGAEVTAETQTTEKKMSFTPADYEKPITIQDIEVLRGIGRKSINKFTSEDIEKAQKWAYKFYQEMGTKSPFFRAWFGDWRAYSTDLINTVVVDKNATLKAGKITNRDTNKIMSWNPEAAKESVLNASKESKADIAVIAENLPKLVESAILLDTTVSEKSSNRKMAGTAFMHSFYCIAKIDNRHVLVKMYAEEALSPKSGEIFTRAYSLKYIEKVAEFDNGVHLENESLTESHSTTNYSIADLFAFVKQYDKEFSPKPVNELMLDEDGTPKVFYHGTNAEFTVFDVRKSRIGAFGKGFYLSPSKTNAKMYGSSRIIESYVDLQNPYVVEDSLGLDYDTLQKMKNDLGESQRITDKNAMAVLKKHNYDGIVVMNNGRIKEIVVYDPKKIKSATDNIGTFDSTNPDIRYSLGEETADVKGNEAEAEPTDREILAMALEGAVQSEQEYAIVKEYREQASMLDLVEEKKKSYAKEASSLERQIKALRERMNEEGDPNGFIRKAMDEAIAKKRQAETMRDEQERILDDATRKLASLRAAKPFRELISREQRRAKAAEQKAAKAVEQAEAKVEKANERADKRIQKEKERLKEQAEMSADRKEITIRMREARRVLGYLSTMLYHPTKQKHVPESLQALVEKALRSADPKQFGINRDHIREMSELAGKIRNLESKAGRTTAEQETLDKMKTKYEKLEADTISVKRQAEALMTAFEQYVTSTTDGEQIDKNMLEGLRQTVTEIEEAPLNEMTLESLKAVENIYTVIYHQVDTANQAFATEKAASIDQMSTKANTEVKDAKALRFLSPQAREWAALANVRSFLWKNMKPLTVFEAIGSNELMTIFRRVLDAEDVWITDVLEAKETLDKAKKQYGYNKWNLKERREITTADGSKTSLTLGEMMSLYAYMFREQAEEHLSAGGFVFAPNAEAIESFKGDKGKYRTHLNDQTPHRMRKEDIAKMSEMLTEEQRAYAKTVQEYLTSLGAKGNEVSRKLYGIDLFKETAYFPIKSSHDYIETSTGKSGDPNIKSRGTFKETVPRAGNPIVLEDFMEVVGNHVNTMATYHAFVLPVEDLTRVWNYTPVNIKRDADGKAILDKNGMPVADTEGAAGYNSLKAEITKKYGKEANDYILQLLRDLNGGARRESAASILDKGLTAFKRSATMLSLSTIVQQPTSFVRAMAYIKPEYFKGASKVAWETVKKYAPVAAIKEMGGFDTGTGARTSEFLNAKDYDNWKDALKAAVTPEVYGGDPNVRAEAFGWLTAKADEITWKYMFGACINEQAAKLGKAKDSEEVLQAAGKRFAEVVRHTQVYDSTLTRSEYMRSEDGLMKMATAFGAEPTTVFSMAAEALIKLERGDKTFFKNTAAAVAGSILLNAVVSSLVYAMRDDDEDKNFLEKHTESVTGEIIEGFNPLEYLPILRDVMSVFKGYDIERTDMSLISNLYQQVELITSSKRSPMDKIAGVSGAVGAFFGIPITNVYRDAKGLALTTSKVLDPEPITGRGVGKAVGEGFKGQFGLFDKLFGKERGDSYELYRAYVKGDKAQYARIAARYDTPEAEEQALRRELRENEKRIVEAAEAKYSGELEVYESLVDQIAAEGVFDRSMVIRAVNNEVSAIKRAAEKGEITAKDDTADEEVAESLYSSSDLNAALERGDAEDYRRIFDGLVSDKVAAGKTEAQARSAVKSSITSYWKKLWLAGYQDTETRKRIIQLLTDTGLYGSRNDVALMCEGWVKDAAKKQ